MSIIFPAHIHSDIGRCVPLFGSIFLPFRQSRLNDWIDEWLDGDPDQGGAVSRLYESIQMIASPSLNNIKAAWEEELGFEVSGGS